MSEIEQNAQTVDLNETQTVSQQEGQDVSQVDPREKLLSSKFANLTKKERELINKERELKSKYEQVSKFESLKGSAKDRMDEVLSELGLSVDDIIAHKLAQLDSEELEQDDSLEGKYRKLEKKLTSIEQEKLKREEEEKRLMEEREQKYIDETISSFKKQINEHIESNAENYELIAAQQAHDQVFEVIEEYFTSTGKVMSIQEAANLVESYFEDEAKKILSRTSKLKKFLTPEEVVESVEKQDVFKTQKSEILAEVIEPTKQPSRTLTQDVVIPSVRQEDRLLSREESLRRAAQKLQWK